MKSWTITDKETGEIIHPSFLTEDNQHPRDVGWDDKSNHNFISFDKAPDLTEQVWVEDHWIDNIEVIRYKKWDQVKAIRARREYEPLLTTSMGVIQIDQRSRDRLRDETERATTMSKNDPDFKTEWTLYDNTVKEVTADDLINVTFEIADYTNKVFKRARDLRREIFREDITLEALKSLDLEQGWPSEEVSESPAQ